MPNGRATHHRYCNLNAYGDHVFKNVPVVVTNFTTELTNGVDYISTTQGSAARKNAINEVSGAERVALGLSDPQVTAPTSWAPAMSMFTHTVTTSVFKSCNERLQYAEIC
jgi:hypothetical protein